MYYDINTCENDPKMIDGKIIAVTLKQELSACNEWDSPVFKHLYAHLHNVGKATKPAKRT